MGFTGFRWYILNGLAVIFVGVLLSSCAGEEGSVPDLMTLGDETDRFEWSLDEFRDTFRRRGLAELIKLGPVQLLQKAVTARFFSVNKSDGKVIPAIPIWPHRKGRRP